MTKGFLYNNKDRDSHLKNLETDSLSCFPIEIISLWVLLLNANDLINFSVINKRIFFLIDKHLPHQLLKASILNGFNALHDRMGNCDTIKIAVQQVHEQVKNLSFNPLSLSDRNELINTISKIKVKAIVQTGGKTELTSICEQIKMKLIANLPFEDLKQLTFYKNKI